MALNGIEIFLNLIKDESLRSPDQVVCPFSFKGSVDTGQNGTTRDQPAVAII